MQRGSDRHSPRADDDLKKEFAATEHANRPTRAHEWRDPEVEDRSPGTPEPETEPGPVMPDRATTGSTEEAEQRSETAPKSQESVASADAETGAIEPSPEERAQHPVPDEERTATGQNPDGDLSGAWAASGEVAQRPTARRRLEEQHEVRPTD